VGWKAVARSSPGTSHQHQGIACQDYASYQVFEDVIVGAVADGAGSAKYAEVGSQLAVETTLKFLSDYLEKRKKSSGQKYSPPLSEEEAENLFGKTVTQVQRELSKQAVSRDCFAKDLACTLLVFIATPNWIAAMQIGDGFIVVHPENSEEYQLLFQPDKGEFTNETAFIMSPNAVGEMQIRVIAENPKFICASTGGLQKIAIRFSDWQPFPLFFQPFEEYLRETDDPETEDQYLHDFLNSERLNQRTNDDKTLLLCLWENQSNSMTVLTCTNTGKSITLLSELVNSGEAKIWRTNYSGHLAKIYHSPTPERIEKLAVMIAHPPREPNAHLQHISFAWPKSILKNSQGEHVGFLMPEIKGAKELLDVYNYQRYSREKLEIDWQFLHVTAQNIASIIEAIHAAGYVLGDIKPQNILVNSQALPSIIDTDSFQVRHPKNGKIYRCLVGSEGYTPPELIGQDFSQVEQTEVHDRFRLAVIIYQLLFGGQTPFQGKWVGPRENPEPSELVRQGIWLYGTNSLIQPVDRTIPLAIVALEIQQCFLRCLNDGHRVPNSRPSAQEWVKALKGAVQKLTLCGKVNSHYYSQTYGKCYWCDRSSKLGVDIFPPKVVSTLTPVPTPQPKVAANHKVLTCTNTGQSITLLNEIISSGEAKIWQTSYSGHLAKIYHTPTPERIEKLAVMIAHPPQEPNAHLQHISFAWPKSILKNAQGDCVGFLMPEIKGGRELLDVYNFQRYSKEKLEVNWYFLHAIAQNIASIIEAIHAAGYVLGDIKPQNILVNNQALPSIIDTDSFQVRNPRNGKIYRCLVGSVGYTPPELIGQDFGQVEQTEVHDRFRLAVIIYQLLFGGQTPFQGKWIGPGTPPQPSELVRQGLWLYGINSLIQAVDRTIPLAIVDPEIRQCFLRCFNDGHQVPNLRPNAQAWAKALKGAVQKLALCGKVNSHFYSQTYGKCYWCDRSSQLGVDIFPPKVVSTPTQVSPPQPVPVQPTINSIPISEVSSIALASNNPATVASSDLVNTLTGHSGSVNSIAISPDGNTLVSGSADNTIKIWNLGTGVLKFTLIGHSGSVNSVAISLDGNTLVSGSYDKTIKIWDLATGVLKFTLTGHSGYVSCVAISPDGNTLVSGSEDKTVKIWNLATGVLKSTLIGHSGTVNSVAISPDGNTLVSGVHDGTIKIWHMGTGVLKSTLTGHSGPVWSLAISPDSNTLVSAGYDGIIKIWNLEGKLKSTLTDPSGSVRSLAISPDGNTLISGGLFSWTIKIWNLGTGELKSTLTGHSGTVTLIAINPDGNTLVSASADQTIKIWRLQNHSNQNSNKTFTASKVIQSKPNVVVPTQPTVTSVASGNLVNTLTGHSDWVRSVAISSDGNTLVSGSADNTIKIWHLGTGVLKSTLTGHSKPILSVAISPDGNTLVSGSADKTIKIWNLGNLGLKSTLAGHSDWIYSIAISPDGNILVSGSADGTIKIWNLARGVLKSTLTGHSGWVMSVAISLDGNTLVSGSSDNTIKIWNLATGVLKSTLTGHSKPIWSVAISPDGNTLVSGSIDKTIKIWNLRTLGLKSTLTGHSDWFRSVAISPDGKTLVSGSSDNTIKIWNLATGVLKSTLTGHSKLILSVAISPDGKTLVSGSGDNTIKIWRLQYHSDQNLNQSIKSSKVIQSRPIVITGVCIFGFTTSSLGIILCLILIPRTHMDGFIPFLLLVSLLSFLSFIGMWMMKKWGVYTYTFVFVFAQVVLLSQGLWGLPSIIIPVIIIMITLCGI